MTKPPLSPHHRSLSSRFVFFSCPISSEFFFSSREFQKYDLTCFSLAKRCADQQSPDDDLLIQREARQQSLRRGPLAPHMEERTDDAAIPLHIVASVSPPPPPATSALRPMPYSGAPLSLSSQLRIALEVKPGHVHSCLLNRR